MRLSVTSAIALSTLLAATLTSTQALAAEPDYTLSYNIGATTDYRFRGISQTSFKPAVQGGADFSHKSGAYLGVWGANVNWVKDYAVGATDGSMEVDLYGGYKGELMKDLGFDVGIIGYIYPGNNATTNANTTELYVALSYGPITAKYSRSLTNFVSNADSNGSQYLEAAATFDLGNGFSLTPHIGRQIIPNQTTSGDYTDYSLTLGKDFGSGISGSVSAVGTDAKDGGFYADKVGNSNLGKSGVFASLKYSF